MLRIVNATFIWATLPSSEFLCSFVFLFFSIPFVTRFLENDGTLRLASIDILFHTLE